MIIVIHRIYSKKKKKNRHDLWNVDNKDMATVRAGIKR